jgi:hypothetical protein
LRAVQKDDGVAHGRLLPGSGQGGNRET